jgi:hypothetical protein
MSADQTVAPYVFVVDTDHYAGNFERPMVAYMTGAVGECEVGQEEADLFEENGLFLELTDKTSHELDDHGCARPASIWTTPGRYNNGNGKHFDGNPTGAGKYPAYESVAAFFSERPTDEEIEFMKQRAHEYVEYKHQTRPAYFKDESQIRIKGFRLITQQVSTQEQSV